MSELRQKGEKRPPLRLISIAWGESYVDTFLELCLPALLAPGNLPALAEHFEVELVFVTETRFFGKARSHPSFARASRVCVPRLAPLDDLVATRKSYGMSLTYAFFRGFQDLGLAMTECTFVFIHADFVLADGSYRNLLPHLLRGEHLVLSPSYCTIDEGVRPNLLAAKDRDEPVLSVAPRRMADLILRNRHYTIRAKTVNQRFFRLSYCEQFYWMVDESTMLCHQLPIAVVAMKPERYLEDVTAYWDYGVILEFCPSGKYAVLGDSDEFLMMELREHDTAKLDLSLGWPSPRMIAANLATFITEYKRGIGRARLTLHSRDIPPGTEEAHAELDRYLGEVYSKLPRQLLPHLEHPQWTYHRPTFQAARSEFLSRANAAPQTLVAEPATAPGATTSASIAGAFARAREDLRGAFDQVAGEAASKLSTASAESFSRTLQSSSRNLDKILAFEAVRATYIRDVIEQLELLKSAEGLARENVVGRLDAMRADVTRRMATLMDTSAQVTISQSAAEAAALSLLEENLRPFRVAVPEVLAAVGRVEKTLAGQCASTRLAAAGPQAVRADVEDRSLPQRIAALLLGRSPRYRSWHWLCSCTRLAISAALQHAARDRNVLLLQGGTRLFDFVRGHFDDVASAPIGVSQMPGVLRHLVADSRSFDCCVIEADFSDLRNLRIIYEEARPLLKPGASIVALFTNVALKAYSRYDADFIRNTFPICGPGRIAYSGSWASVAAFRLRLGIARTLSLAGFGSSAANAAAMLTAAPFALIGSLLEAGRTLDNAFNPPQTVTAVTLEIKVG